MIWVAYAAVFVPLAVGYAVIGSWLLRLLRRVWRSTGDGMRDATDKVYRPMLNRRTS